MSASPARVAAARALLAVDEGAHLDEMLAEMAPTSGADRDLAWFLAYGVLRRRGHVDAALNPLLSRPLLGLDPPVRAVLRLGAFERLYARTRPHAVVHQAVEVARALGVGRASALVNAVLRKVDGPPPEAEDHPAWLLERWRARYGDEATRAWCDSNAEPPPLFVVGREPLPPGSQPTSRPAVWRVDPAPAAPIPTLPGFDEGAWWVQDLASVAVADLVGAGQGTRVLDACAAPGGKAFRLASQGACVLAVDRSGKRLERVQVSAARLGLDVPTRVHDWTRGPMNTGETFDAVIVDAPCSALGTVRRHPEVRWRRQEPDLEAAGRRQSTILAAAASHVAPGGVLVYAVCSPEPEEGPEVIERFLAEAPFDLEATVSTAPPQEGEDAHYAVRTRRRA